MHCAELRGVTNDDVSSISLECRTCPAERSSLTPPFYAAAVIKSVSLAPVLQSVPPVAGSVCRGWRFLIERCRHAPRSTRYVIFIKGRPSLKKSAFDVRRVFWREVLGGDGLGA